MSIVIGADLVPTQSNYKLFEQQNIETILGVELMSLLQKADYRIFNLETPLTDVATPIKKCGPALMTPTAVVPCFKAMGIDLFTLSNNHIMDQGQQGFEKTVELLQGQQIAYVGAGDCLAEAVKPHIFKYAGKQIGVYACAEHEFSIATENSMGANPFEPLESLEHIAELKSKCDYVIVLYHGGKEYYRYPSPNLQKVCRKMVEKGADLVVCQHSHCIGCQEEYGNGLIVYGQGNFVFDDSDEECWQTSLLILLNERLELSYVPLMKQKNVVRLANEKQGEDILSAFKQRSQEILTFGFIEKKYEDVAKSALPRCLLIFSGVKMGFFFRVINKLTGCRYAQWYVKKRFSSEKLLAIQNYIECEAHRESLILGVKEHV